MNDLTKTLKQLYEQAREKLEAAPADSPSQHYWAGRMGAYRRAYTLSAMNDAAQRVALSKTKLQTAKKTADELLR